MGTVTRSSTTSVAASVDAVWKVLADQFVEIADWAGGVRSSSPNPEAPEGVNGSKDGGRICEVDGVGTTDERIVAYDDQAHSLSYSVQATGLPFFVAGLRNTWTVRPDGPARCIVDVEFSATTKGIVGVLGALPLGRLLGKGATGLPLDLKTYVETGTS